MSNKLPNWKTLSPSPPQDSRTVAAQGTLPMLPVPPLNSTLDKLKQSLKPLAWNEAEYDAAEKKIDEFAKSGVAAELQRRLEQRRDQTNHWLEEWWDSGAYFGYRDSVVVNVSYFYGFDEHPAHLPKTPVHRAAALTRSALLFRKQYKLGLLEPEKVKGAPICMDTYRWMFDCCRVPSPGLDWCVSYAKEGDTGDSGHIIVLRKNKFWRVDIAKDGVLLSTADLERQFQHIYDNSHQEYPGIGMLTASNRDVWAKDFETLSSTERNKDIISQIHSSAFLVCLDDVVHPPKASQFGTHTVAVSKTLWHGGPSGQRLSNRWVDKPVQFIVCDDGIAGVMGEHSVMDGTPIARMCDDVLDAIADKNFDHGTSIENITAPVSLEFEIPSEIPTSIEEARRNARTLCDSQDVGFFLTGYGKKVIKTFNCSPDSWAQMMVQLAYRRLLYSSDREAASNEYNILRQGGTYEAASTRKFFKGRTETIRVVTEASDAWVRSMEPNSGIDDEGRRALFREACKLHGELAREGGNAQGIDRHLLGLKKCVQPTEEVPAVFTDPLVNRSNNWVLSTSAIFSKHFHSYGWGEVVPNGFGVCYMTGFDDYIFFTITSRREMPNMQFCEEIKRASSDLYNLFAPHPRL